MEINKIEIIGMEKLEQIKKPISKKDYFKEYYLKNKEKIYNNTVKNKSKNSKEVILKKLNEGIYKRMPYEKMKKYNITFDNDLQQFI